MPEVEAPIVGSEVDTSDPSGSAASIATGIAGVGLMTIVLRYGNQLGNWAAEQVEGATGANGGADSDIVLGEF